MSTIGSFEGFQPVSLKQEGDDQPSETDQLSVEEGDPGKDPMPKQISRQPSVTKSTLYPNPYHRPYISRKYFVTRPGAIETAMEDLKGHIAKTSGEKIQGFWLLTEIDHWNNEKERILLVTDKNLLICKYDFIMLSCVQLQWIPLGAVYRICLGKFAFPGMSLDNQNQFYLCINSLLRSHVISSPQEMSNRWRKENGLSFLSMIQGEVLRENIWVPAVPFSFLGNLGCLPKSRGKLGQKFVETRRRP
ncbi:tumor protein p63-regulated gene 1 protein isoform X3 [Pteropus medius]|uniref:tumor protein p63-regulated gene 1 protein isoform X3 n=1 Tax=Pteropus vampyrus TaxID=132908 RepID=UPI00196B3632|nr:tumor protein p63-regulated gene 1 protein isoform X3 [Pteropus giganteus]